MNRHPITACTYRDRSIAFGVFAVVGLWSLSFGEVRVLAEPAPKTAPSGLPAEMNSLRTAGWEAVYRTDYEDARRKFTELQQRFPTHPAGDLSLASLIWQEYLFRTRRLQSNLYNRDSGFYAGARHSKEGAEGDQIDPTVDAVFQDHLGKAMAKAQALVDSNPKDAESLYFLGAAYGIRAAYEASAQRRFWAALHDGVRSVKLEEQVIALDPTFYDAYLTLGTYHYAVGCIPQPFRAMVSMGGIHGGKQQGIRELETVEQKGIYNRDDARVVLIALYGYENNPQRALGELQAISARYPENSLLRIEIASTLTQLKRPAEAHATFDRLLQGSDKKLFDLIHFRYAESLAHDRAYLEAASQFAAVDQTPGAYPPLAAEALLRAGQMYDLAGHRPEAIRSYQASRVRPGSSEDVRKTADRLIREPFKL